MSDYRVTFGQQYPREPHLKFPRAHRNGWVTIEAANYNAAHRIAFEVLGEQFAFVYDVARGECGPDWNDMFPLGELARFG